MVSPSFQPSACMPSLTPAFTSSSEATYWRMPTFFGVTGSAGAVGNGRNPRDEANHAPPIMTASAARARRGFFMGLSVAPPRWKKEAAVDNLLCPLNAALFSLPRLYLGVMPGEEHFRNAVGCAFVPQNLGAGIYLVARGAGFLERLGFAEDARDVAGNGVRDHKRGRFAAGQDIGS